MIKGKSKKHTASPRQFHHFVVRVPNVATKRELQTYVREAVQGWAGGGDPSDPLFGSAREIVVKGTLYEMEKATLMNLKKDIQRYFEGNDLPSGIYCDVMGIIDNYLMRT